MFINFFNFLTMISQIQNMKQTTIFYIIFCLLFLKINTFYNFRAYNLLSEDVLLITDEGIIILNPETKEQTLVYYLNDTSFDFSYEEAPYISFADFSYDDGNYSFCRIKDKIYIFANNFINIITQTEMTNSSVSLIPYQNGNKNKILFVCFINTQKELQIEEYKINTNNEIQLINKVNNITLIELINVDEDYDEEEDEDFLYEEVIEYSYNHSITCQLLNDKNYTNDLLVCFIETNLHNLKGLVFNPEYNLEYVYLISDKISPFNILLFKSSVSLNKDFIIIVYVEHKCTNSYEYYCIIYNIEYKKWSKKYYLDDFRERGIFDFDIIYIRNKDEYLLYYQQNVIGDFEILKLDSNFYVKKQNNSNDYNCYEYKGYLDEFYFPMILLFNNNKLLVLYYYKLGSKRAFLVKYLNYTYNHKCNLNYINIIEKIQSSIFNVSETNTIISDIHSLSSSPIVSAIETSYSFNSNNLITSSIISS